MYAAMLGGGEVILILAVLFLVPLCLALTAFWIWMLVCAIQNKGLSDGERTGWVLAIALLHFLGAVLYFFIGHPKRNMPVLSNPPVMQPGRQSGCDWIEST
jgi:hypothetical protein